MDILLLVQARLLGFVGRSRFLESVSFINGRKQDRQRRERGERREGEGGRKEGNEGARLPSVAADITG